MSVGMWACGMGTLGVLACHTVCDSSVGIAVQCEGWDELEGLKVWGLRWCL